VVYDILPSIYTFFQSTGFCWKGWANKKVFR